MSPPATIDLTQQTTKPLSNVNHTICTTKTAISLFTENLHRIISDAFFVIKNAEY